MVVSGEPWMIPALSPDLGGMFWGQFGLHPVFYGTEISNLPVLCVAGAGGGCGGDLLIALLSPAKTCILCICRRSDAIVQTKRHF